MAERLDGTSDVKGRRQRVAELCNSLPDAEVERAGAQHLAFKVNKKVFGYYSYDHHGDGVIAVWCKAPPGEQGRLVAERPAVYFVPAYVGPKGWIGIRLDTARVDWAAVKDHLFAAWLMSAPTRLKKQVQTDRSAKPPLARRPRTRQEADEAPK
jgi:hypothetical protein